MVQERCPNCFEPGYRGGSCGRCGFQASYDKRSVRALPAGVVLKRRYFWDGFWVKADSELLIRHMTCRGDGFVPSKSMRRQG